MTQIAATIAPAPSMTPVANAPQPIRRETMMTRWIGAEIISWFSNLKTIEQDPLFSES